MMFHFMSTRYVVESTILLEADSLLIIVFFTTNKKFTLDFCDCFCFLYFKQLRRFYIDVTMMMAVSILISYNIEDLQNHAKNKKH